MRSFEKDLFFENAVNHTGGRAESALRVRNMTDHGDPPGNRSSGTIIISPLKAVSGDKDDDQETAFHRGILCRVQKPSGVQLRNIMTRR